MTRTFEDYNLAPRCFSLLDRGARQRFIHYIVNLRAEPAVGLVASAQTQLQVIVGESFGEVAAGVAARDSQSDRV